MEWAIDHGDVRIALGDAVERLREMPDESVQCIVTSPPFFALRDYGTGRWEGGDESCDHVKAARHQVQGATSQRAGRKSAEHQRNDMFVGTCGRCGAVRVDRQIGLEETPELWVEALVAVFAECRRVLRDDGVMWLECGDTYATTSTYRAPQSMAKANGWAQEEARVPRPNAPGVKAKDLVGAPWLLGFALRGDGWYLRSEVIWDKVNAMPESVLDRPTTGHSRVFLLAKTDRYFYDAEAIRQPHKHDGRRATKIASNGAGLTTHENYEGRQNSERWPGSGANARTVWSIATQPTPWAHFATFPEKLVERCIMAGTSEAGGCLECGSPWRRLVVASGGTIGAGWHDHETDDVTGQRNGGSSRGWETYRREERGWVPTCDHYDHLYYLMPRPSNRRKAEQRDMWPGRWMRVRSRPAQAHWVTAPNVVLDPFMGSGTTAVVARRLGRHAVGVELNPAYLEICEGRLKQLSLLT